MRAAAQRRDRATCGYCALRNEFAAIAAEPRDHAVHQWIVESAVDLGDSNSALGPGKDADLPIGDMAGEDNHSPSGRDCAIAMLEAIRIDAPACFTDAYFPQVRIFGRDAADITPHAADEVCDLGLGKPGKGAADVAPSISRPRKGPIRRASAPPTAEAQSSGTSLNTPSKNAAPQASRRLVSRGATTEKLGRVRAICRGRYHNRRDKPSKLRRIRPRR